MSLHQYIQMYARRGPCTCGRCCDAVENPETKQPTGEHTADVIFFKVSAMPGANAHDLKKLIEEHKGEFCECNLFDGDEHNFIEIGGWIGDQGFALTLMGLGAALGLWKLLTPRTMFGEHGMPEEIVNTMAGRGMVAIMAPR